MLKTLVLTRFKGMFFRKPPEGKKQKNMTWLYIVLYGYLCFTFGGLFLLNYQTFYSAFVEGMNMPEMYFGLASIISMMLGFIGSVTMTQSQLYDAKDNELLLSMPIPPSYILGSRMLVIFLMSVLFSCVPLIPAFCVEWLAAGSFSVSGLLILIAMK